MRQLSKVLLVLAIFPTLASSQVQISNNNFQAYAASLNAAATLAGTESIPCLQSPSMVACTPSQLSTYINSQLPSYLGAPPPIGGVTPGSGAFTTLSATGLGSQSLIGQTANTKIVSFDFENATPATTGNQQDNCVAVGGHGFGTTAGTSQAVQLQLCTVPVQSTVPTLNWILGARIAGGSFVNLLEGTYAGAANFTLSFDGTGNFTAGGSVLAPWVRVNGSTSTTPTGSGLYACNAATSPTCVGFDIAGASVGTYTTSAFTFLGNVISDTAGSGLQVKEGSNAKQGTCTLSAGSAACANSSVTANSRIILTSNADGGTPGWLRVSARSAGTSFTITSSSGTDTSVVAYEIFEPAP